MNKLMYLLLGIFLSGCTPTNNNEKTIVEKRQYTKERNPVEIMVLEKTAFKKELVSTGKLKALRKSNLKFRLTGEIEKLYVKNGSYVEAGQPIAKINQFEQQQKLQQAKLRLDKASLDLKEALIGQGLNPDDTVNIPPDIYKIVQSRSGYSTALNDLKTAQYEIESTILVAPFDGKIANLKSKQYESVPSEEFCLLIDDSTFEVEFSVLETETKEIGLDKKVKIIPFSSEEIINGHVTEINPFVDENGLIKIKAVIKNQGNLLEGMNVKVLVENEIANQLVVPKSAVLQRDNQEVLFKYTNGIAWWVYVQKLYENSTSYAVIAHPDKGGTLEPGDTIIISGNLNLAHESEVEVK